MNKAEEVIRELLLKVNEAQRNKQDVVVDALLAKINRIRRRDQKRREEEK